MRNDLSVLITQAEKRGASFRVNNGHVEVLGMENLPNELVSELRDCKAELLRHLMSTLAQMTTEEISGPLSWASELSEQELVLADSVSFVEAPLRNVTTTRVSWYAAHYLRTINFSLGQQETGGWGNWTPEWWRERQQEAVTALANLKDALDIQKVSN
jgi:hypothetical protein